MPATQLDTAAPPAAAASSWQLTALRQLRILYLHHITLEGLIPLEAWEPLRACTALAFLSISANELERLPPAVADMAHLQVCGCLLLGGGHLRKKQVHGALVRRRAASGVACPAEHSAWCAPTGQWPAACHAAGYVADA